MPLWKIEPMAESGDSRWLDHDIWREVIVRAPTAAMARVIAGELERRQMAGSPPVGNESLSFRSGFDDEKLYRVTEIAPDALPDVPADGPDEIVRKRRLRD